MNKWKRSKIITTICWVGAIVSIPWIIGTIVITTKFNDQRKITNQSKLEEENSKSKNERLNNENKKLDDKIKTLEIEKQSSTKHINILKNKNTQQEKIHDEWYVQNSKNAIEKLEKELEEEEATNSELTNEKNTQQEKIKEFEELINVQYDYIYLLDNYVEIFQKISTHKLLEKIRKLNNAKLILDQIVYVKTKQKTKVPTEVSYSNFQDFIEKTNFIFKIEKEDFKEITKIFIKVEIKEEGDNFQIVTLKIQEEEKGKIIIESEVEVGGFKSK